MTKPPKTMEEIKNAGADNYFIMGFELTPDKYLPMAFKAGFDCRDKLGDEALELANAEIARLIKGEHWTEQEMQMAKYRAAELKANLGFEVDELKSAPESANEIQASLLRRIELLESEIVKLEKALKIAVESLEFYGATANWTSLSTRIEYDVFTEENDLKHIVIGNDEQGVISVKMAGSKAREALEEIRKLRPES